MSLHLIPFVAGVVVGALATNLYRDKKLHKTLKKSAAQLTGKVKDAADAVAEKSATLQDRIAAEDDPEDSAVSE